MKNNENLNRVSELVENLITEEVANRTEELREKASHFESISGHYARLIHFLVEDNKLDISDKTAKALEAFKRAEESDAMNGYYQSTSYTCDKEFEWRCYDEIKEICEEEEKHYGN